MYVALIMCKFTWVSRCHRWSKICFVCKSTISLTEAWYLVDEQHSLFKKNYFTYFTMIKKQILVATYINLTDCRDDGTMCGRKHMLLIRWWPELSTNNTGDWTLKW